MTKDEKEELVQLIKVAVSETVEAESKAVKEAIALHESSPSHVYVDMLIARAERRQRMFDRIKGSFIFWLLVASTSAIGLAVWEALLRSVKSSAQ